MENAKNKINLDAFQRIKDLHTVYNLLMSLFPSQSKLDSINGNTNFDKIKIESLKNHYKACRNILKQIYNENKIWFNKNKTKLNFEKKDEYERILKEISEII